MIYWDNNATTAVTEEVLAEMLPFFGEKYMNPSSGYGVAREVRDAIEEARYYVARLAGASADEMVFTSGATESINTVLCGMRSMSPKCPVLCLATDHAAALNALGSPDEMLLSPVDAEGRVLADEWERLISRQVAGATFILGNNETGIIQPDAERMIKAAKDNDVPIHVDAVQCLGKMPLGVTDLGVDYASFSAHKLHGPKGVGALYVRSGVRLIPLIKGGDQESLRRGGTENVPGIIGFGAAAKYAFDNFETDSRRMREQRDRFEGILLAGLGGIYVLSGETHRLPNTSCICFDDCTAQALSLVLESKGLLCSAGSACKTASPSPSHVLMAMGLSDDEARSCLRFSISSLTTDQEVEEAAQIVTDAVRKVRGAQSSKTGPVIIYNP